MMKIGLLMIGCTGIATTGCITDAPAEDGDQTEVAAADLTTPPGGPTANTIGAAHVIRLTNTNLCLQPANGSLGDVVVELRTCRPANPNDPASRAQHWLLSQKTSVEWQFVNLASGKCLYNGVDTPFNGARPITHEGCNIFGTSSPASNGLWRISALRGNSQLQSRVGHRDTGFCLDVPDGRPFEGVQLQNFRCNGTPAQIFVINQD